MISKDFEDINDGIETLVNVKLENGKLIFSHYKNIYERISRYFGLSAPGELKKAHLVLDLTPEFQEWIVNLNK